jgi:hypothetical protein
MIIVEVFARAAAPRGPPSGAGILTDPDAAALWQPALSVRSVLLGSSTRSSLHFCKFSRERISRYMSRRGRRGLWDTCCKRRYGTEEMKAVTI